MRLSMAEYRAGSVGMFGQVGMDLPDWKTWTQQYFPGFVAQGPRRKATGRVAGGDLGIGRLWHLQEPKDLVIAGQYPERSELDAVVVLQVSGSSVLRSAQVTANQLTIGRNLPGAFELRCDDDSERLLLQVPWSALKTRHPLLSEQPRTYNADEPGVALIAGALHSAVRELHTLVPAQRSSLLGALVHLAGLPGSGSSEQRVSDSRVDRVLQVIERELPDPGLDPDRLARSQRLSRRRLDELFRREVGSSISANIRARRLARARELLRDPGHAAANITEVGLSVGFSDGSHFSRTFQSEFGVTPTAFRRRTDTP